MSIPTFQQLFDYDTWTYTYLLANPDTKDAVIIDPVVEQTERDLTLLNELGLRLRTILDTHIHADHVTGAAALREATGATYALGAVSGLPCADTLLDDGQVIPFGDQNIVALATPGHTDESMCYLFGDRVFTGDTLFVRSTGRTDFQNGSTQDLWDSITNKLFTLPDETLVYPAHDYQGRTATTIGDEKRLNVRAGLGHDYAAFAQVVDQAQKGKPLPGRVKVALPANRNCGVTD